MAEPATHRYGVTAQGLHWAIAALIVLQFLLAEAAEQAAQNDALAAQLRWLADHKSIGMTILMLAVVRLLWRFWARPPAALPAPRWQQQVARGTHLLLYGLLFVLPLSGWLGSSAAAYSVSWFGWLQWPDLVAPDPALKERLYRVHEYAGTLLLILAALHLLAALKHHWLDRDHTLQRMTSTASVALFTVLLALGLSWMASTELRRADGPAPAATIPAKAAAPAIATEQSTAPQLPSVARADDGPQEPSTLPRWILDYERSRVLFSADQAGARFEGHWQQWQADIAFDPAALERSQAVVRFDATSAVTGDSDRDDTLTSAEFLAADRFPEVEFRANAFQALGDGRFRADGRLSVKGLTVAVPFEFSVEQQGTARRLDGTARLDRLALAIGTGDWADTSSIGQYIEVRVTVRADVPE